MTINYLMTFDPGKSSGIVLGKYSETEAYERVAFWQVEGGIGGLVDWYFKQTFERPEMGDFWRTINYDRFGIPDPISVSKVTYVSERFVPLSGGGFSQTSDSIEPVRIEGALIALGLMPHDYTDKAWQRPAAMYFSGGSTKPERLKANRAFLKKHGLLVTGKQVGCKDANDVNSAQLHALAYMRKIKHVPTIQKFWPDDSGGE